MDGEYIAFNFGKKDGSLLTQEEFFRQHRNIKISSLQKKQLLQNLERQCVLVLKEFSSREVIVLQDFTAKFIYQDDETQEWYLKPLEVELRVYFMKTNPVILIYDMKMVA